MTFRSLTAVTSLLKIIRIWYSLRFLLNINCWEYGFFFDDFEELKRSSLSKFESEILRSINNIELVKGIKIEVSLESLYSDSKIINEMIEVITEIGFIIWDLVPGFRSKRNFKLLQIDIVAFRNA